MLALQLPAGEIHKYSWHSFRSWLACALMAMVDADGKRVCDNGTIQCFLRWRSEEAVRIYGRLNPSAYAGMLQRAVLSDVSSVRTTNLHRTVVIDADQRAAELQRALPQMYAHARNEDAGEEEPLEDIEEDELDPSML